MKEEDGRLSRWRRALSRMFAPTPRDEGDALVLLGRPDGEAEARLWANILEQWGVRALVKNTSATAYAGFGDAFEVWVLENDVEEARQLLGVREGDGEDEGHGEGEGEVG
jgi:hypothetical protein